jgi:mRNA-degrading endonuclease RelE of RelBE toxin-antitoxin system
MSFKVLVHMNVRKSLKELPEGRIKQINDLVDILENDPVPFRIFDISRIEGHEGLFRVRLGFLRITYEVDESLMRVKLLDLDPRGKAYKKL